MRINSLFSNRSVSASLVAFLFDRISPIILLPELQDENKTLILILCLNIKLQFLSTIKINKMVFSMNIISYFSAKVTLLKTWVKVIEFQNGGILRCQRGDNDAFQAGKAPFIVKSYQNASTDIFPTIFPTLLAIKIIGVRHLIFVDAASILGCVYKTMKKWTCAGQEILMFWIANYTTNIKCTSSNLTFEWSMDVWLTIGL